MSGSDNSTLSDFSVDMGFEHYGLWTVHKWFLVFSVVSVLLCAIIALIYSIMTWYQSASCFHILSSLLTLILSL